MNASISGAEVGCQGEVESPVRWRRRAFNWPNQPSAEQVCVAAEIGMEHNLGLTCDGCRSGAGAVCIGVTPLLRLKRLTLRTTMAMRRTSAPRVSLDKSHRNDVTETGRTPNANTAKRRAAVPAIKVQCD